MLVSKIKSSYEKHNFSRICQGDIFRDFSFDIVTTSKEVIQLNFAYVIVVSQDCDLEHGLKYFTSSQNKNDNDYTVFSQLIPTILILPAYPADEVRKGEHLIKLFNVAQEKINSDKWREVKKNLVERYHFLPKQLDLQVPELVIDFKNYFTVPTEVFVENSSHAYLATFNELYRENLSHRFSNYFSRIGLPMNQELKIE